MEENTYISVKNIAEMAGFSETKTRNYIKKNFGFTKLMYKWIPHTLSDDQKRERVYFCKLFLKKYIILIIKKYIIQLLETKLG